MCVLRVAARHLRFCSCCEWLDDEHATRVDVQIDRFTCELHQKNSWHYLKIKTTLVLKTTQTTLTNSHVKPFYTMFGSLEGKESEGKRVERRGMFTLSPCLDIQN